jgi:hypothetical protein
MFPSCDQARHYLASSFHADFLIGFLFDPEDGRETSVEFQWTTRRYIPDDGIRFDFGSISPLHYPTLEWYFLLSRFLNVTVNKFWIGN